MLATFVVAYFGMLTGSGC